MGGCAGIIEWNHWRSQLSIADAMPHVRDAFNWFFTQLNLGFIEMGIWAAKSDIAIAKVSLRVGSLLSHVPGFKTFGKDLAAASTKVLGPDRGAGALVQLDKLREQRIAEALGLGAAPPTAKGKVGGNTPKGLTDAQIAAQKKLADESQKIASDLRDQIAALTATLVDDLTQQLAAFDAEIAAARKRGVNRKIRPGRPAWELAKEHAKSRQRL